VHDLTSSPADPSTWLSWLKSPAKKHPLPTGPMLSSLLLVCLLLTHTSASSTNKVFEHTVDQSFSGSQSPDDAYMAAITRAKFEVLELAGTYLESLSIVENAVLAKDEVTALAGGVLTTEIVKRTHYATDKTFGIVLTARIEIDTDSLSLRMEKLREDSTLLHKYNEIQEREQELLARIRQLEQMTHNLPDGTPQPESFDNEFTEISAALSASQWLQKAVSLWHNGRFSEPTTAVDYLSRAIAQDADNPRTYNTRAVAYLNMQKLDEAEKDLTTALGKNPNFADAHNNLGSIHYRRGDYEKAIAAYSLAIDLAPGNVEYIVNRGMASRKLFNFEDAFDDFRRAMELAPKPFGKEGDAGSLTELNDIDKSCEKAQTACRMGLCRSLDFLKQRGFCLQDNPTPTAIR
jgi:tetratricopeptide (TPR) repeat protein